jgi:hypothetical protein
MSTLIQSIGFFKDIFNFFLPFLLVFAVLYAILQKTKFLTDDANINALISLAIALIVSISGAADFLMALTPFMATFFIIIFFVLMLFLFFGVNMGDVMKSKAVIVLVVVIAAIFVFYVLGNFMSAHPSASVAATTVNGTNVSVTSSGGAFGTVSEKTCDFTKISGPQAIPCILGNPTFLSIISLLGLLAIVTYFIIAPK